MYTHEEALKALKLKPRPGQLELMGFCDEVFEHGLTAMAEAPTGTGKTISYLVPAIRWAREKGAPAIVATATKNLQDQIAQHDGPRLEAVYPGLKVIVLKGKANYPCLYKVDALEDPYLKEKILAAIEKGIVERSDLLQLFSGEMVDVWADEGCVGSDHDHCPIHVLRERAMKADLVVLNHALLAADRTGQTWPLPSSLIVDEAHRLVDTFTEALTEDFGSRDLQTIERLPALSPSVENGLYKLAKKVGEALAEFSEGLYQLGDRDRSREGIDLSCAAWKELVDELGRHYRHLESYYKAHDKAQDDGTFVLDRYKLRLYRWGRSILGKLGRLINADESRIVWVEFKDGSLRNAPLKVADELKLYLWSRAASSLLISATLTTLDQNFDGMPYGIDDGPAFVGEPVFDYPRQCLLATPQMAPVGSDDRLTQIAEAIAFLTRMNRGSTMALFTSYRELGAVANILAFDLKGEYQLLVQSPKSDKADLLRRFVAGKSVLLGTDAFWEGIDLVGDKLKGLVVARLPFDVPTDPIHSRRGQLYPNPFQGYSLPRTAAKLRQGFGRLIRSTRDKGVVVLMDERVRSKAYGPQLLATLPACATYRGTVEDLPRAVALWSQRKGA